MLTTQIKALLHYSNTKLLVLLAVLFTSTLASGQNFHVFMSMELAYNDPYAPGKFQWVARMYVYKDGTSSFNDRRFEDFSIDFSYDTTKLRNPRYFVVLNTRPVLKPTDTFSLTQGIYSITRTPANLAYPANHIREDIDVSATVTNLPDTNYVGADFSACLTCGEIMRVYFDIDSSNTNTPPAYYLSGTTSNPVYADPATTGFLADTVYDGISTQHHTSAPLNPASNPWFRWPYDATGSGSNAGGLDPDWDLLSGSGGNTSSWSFGGFTTGVLIPLPVEFVSLDLLQTGNQVEIIWTTSSESDNSHFIVERSSDGIHWFEIGHVKGVGNSSQINQYTFTDYQPLFGRAFYRLKQMDTDGQASYSAVKWLIFGSDLAGQITAFPNPVTDQMTILMPEELSDNWIVSIAGMDGRVHFLMVYSDLTQTVIDCKNLKPGIYQLCIRSGELLKTQVIAIH